METNPIKTQQDYIDDIIKRLVPVYNPLEIYVYGQKNWGISDDAGDIEITVVVESSDCKKPLNRGFHGREALRRLGVGKFLFVFTKNEFTELSVEFGENAAYFAKKYGTKIYERA
jgi:hypothetical protein